MSSSKRHVSQFCLQRPVTLPYGVAKVALDHLTRCAALENAPYGVRVNSINPGRIKTLIAKRPEHSVEEHMELMDKISGPLHALGRVGTPDEVADCIAFLASDDAAFVTGTIMPVDGGLILLSSVSGPARSSDTH
nr:cyclohexanol dehydrogenase-like [Dermacentor andersoni]